MRNASIDYSRLDVANPIDLDHPLAKGLQHAWVAIPGNGGGRLVEPISNAHGTLSGPAYWSTRGHQSGLAFPGNGFLNATGKALSSNFTFFIGGAIGTIPPGTAQWVSSNGITVVLTGSTNITGSVRFTGNQTKTVTITSTAKSNDIGCMQLNYDKVNLSGFWNAVLGTSQANTTTPQSSFSQIGNNFQGENFLNVCFQYDRVVNPVDLYYQWKNGFRVKDSMLRFFSKKTYSLGPQFKAYWHRRQQQIIGGGLR